MTTDSRVLPADSPVFDFRIRKVTLADAERLSRFYRELPEESRYFFEPYRDVTVCGMSEVIKRSLAGTDLSCVAVASGGRVVAHFFFMDITRDVPHLGIGLSADVQGLGLGSMFFSYLIALGRSVLHKKAIALTVVKTNVRAIRLYRRYGFAIVREDVTFRSRDDSYEMRLEFKK